MKTFSNVIILAVLILTSRIFAQQWWNEGSPAFSAGKADYTSIAIAPNGIHVVAYSDYGSALLSGQATVMKYSVNEIDPLPVELTSFIESINGSKIILNWQTATEVNNYGFEIQRSEDRSQMSEINRQ